MGAQRHPRLCELMKTKNYKCPECQVCSYCLQHCAVDKPCTHPIAPIFGHCMHNDDITPQDCGICVEKAILKNLKTQIKEFEEVKIPALHGEYGRLKLDHLEAAAKHQIKVKELEKVIYELNSRVTELRSEQDSFFGELATILGGPGRPREGVTRNAYWLGRLGEFLTGLEDLRRKDLDELLGNIVSQWSYGVIRERILAMFNKMPKVLLVDYICIDCNEPRRCIKGAFVCQGCLSTNGRLDS